MLANPTLFLDKEIYHNHGVFDTSFKISADYDLMLRILKLNRLKFGYFPGLVTKMGVEGV